MQKMCILFFILAQSGFIEAMDSFSVIKNSDCQNIKISADRQYIYAAACFNEAITELNDAAMEQNKLNIPEIDGIEFDEQGDVRFNVASIVKYYNLKCEVDTLEEVFDEQANSRKITPFTEYQIVEINNALQKDYPWLAVFSAMDTKVDHSKVNYKINDELHKATLDDLLKTKKLNNALKSTSRMYQLFMGTVIAVQFAYIFYLKKYK